ncbi:MAG TPA: FAD-dependent monooxygenase [Roseiflexaceae bacterium]|jgi:2-polyprenyl-6-methoxyphenol hydroxylase-like FAD-dependent oxidoreductase
MNTNAKKAVIIGGGIAGSVAAMFFKRAGIAAEVYEARSASEHYAGWFLNLAGNGIEVLKTLGIAAPIITEGSPVPRMIIWNGKGKRLGEVRNGARAGLTESVIIRRGALQQRIHEAAMSQGVPIHFGKKLCGIEVTGEHGVIATFEDGTKASGDFLVGGDGIHSRTRQIINPGAPKSTYTGLVSTGGFTNRPALPPTPETQHFVFGKQAFFGYHVRSSGEIYWFNNHGRAQEPGRSEVTAIISEDWKARLLEMHRGDLPLIQEIIRSTESGIGGFPIYDIPPQPIWHKGPVVLVGDAVHAISPSSGQGASLAMEDAAILAKCLRDIAPMEQAFATYERLRRARVERMVEWARSLGGMKTVTNPIQVWLRDLMLPFFLKRSANPTALDWVYAYTVDWDTPVGEEPRQEGKS